jgi:1-deoxy-D-xylulose-5-phosphate synthase
VSSSLPPSPAHLHSLGTDELLQVAVEIRQRILSVCLTHGGHLGASLGAVELAIALHSVFESPREPILWDVGHQAYAHKLLTGRSDRFDTLRQAGGISGFLSRKESAHDVLGAGHSSTSLSFGLALAWEKQRSSATQSDWTIAVIGDGALSSGLALEALHQLDTLDTAPMLIVLNDNQMSISPNVGGIAGLLGRGEAPEWFDLLGCDFVGPVDGHDLETLLGTLRGIRANPRGRPVVLHVLTQKGKGYAPAEEQPAHYHGVSPVGAGGGTPGKSYSEVFGEALCGLAEADEKVVAITPAMAEGSGLVGYRKQFPERFVDTGIAEAHAVTFAAGLAAQGLKPVVSIYSTFLQRAVDSVIHDVALQELPVVFAVDRAGLVGADGPTHHGNFDLAYLGMIPGMHLYCPSTAQDLSLQLKHCLSDSERKAPAAIRYPRGVAPSISGQPGALELRWNSQPSSEPRVVALALGAAEKRVLSAVSQLSATERSDVAVLTVLRAKPFPVELIEFLRARPGVPVVWVEDGVARGGCGEALLSELGPRTSAFQLLAYPDRFIDQGTVSQQEAWVGSDVAAILRAIRSAREAH